MSTYDDTRRAWDDASSKHVREYAELLEQARTARLLPVEEELLRPLIGGAEVLHPQSGHGLDDHALLRLGALSVRGLDYSPTAVGAAQRRVIQSPRGRRLVSAIARLGRIVHPQAMPQEDLDAYLQHIVQLSPLVFFRMAEKMATHSPGCTPQCARRCAASAATRASPPSCRPAASCSSTKATTPSR